MAVIKKKVIIFLVADHFHVTIASVSVEPANDFDVKLDKTRHTQLH